MGTFFEKNKTLLAIIIGAAIYFGINKTGQEESVSPTASDCLVPPKVMVTKL